MMACMDGSPAWRAHVKTGVPIEWRDASSGWAHPLGLSQSVVVMRARPKTKGAWALTGLGRELINESWVSGGVPMSALESTPDVQRRVRSPKSGVRKNPSETANLASGILRDRNGREACTEISAFPYPAEPRCQSASGRGVFLRQEESTGRHLTLSTRQQAPTAPL